MRSPREALSWLVAQRGRMAGLLWRARRFMGSSAALHYWRAGRFGVHLPRPVRGDMMLYACQVHQIDRRAAAQLFAAAMFLVPTGGTSPWRSAA